MWARAIWMIWENMWILFPLPGATDSRLMRRPLAVNLEKPNGEKLTLVFYDVAGEHFAEKTEMDSTLQEGSGVTSYIRNCDAMMLLIDPVQIQALAPGDIRCEQKMSRRQSPYPENPVDLAGSSDGGRADQE